MVGANYDHLALTVPTDEHRQHQARENFGEKGPPFSPKFKKNIFENFGEKGPPFSPKFKKNIFEN